MAEGPLFEEWHKDNDDYETFIKNLRKKLLKHPDDASNVRIYGEHIRGLPLLRQQKPKPPRWIYIKLVLVDDVHTTLAVRHDNVYLIGFKNQEGNWFEFGINDNKSNKKKAKEKKNGGGTRRSSVHLIPDSTFLGYDEQYGTLLSGEKTLDIESKCITWAVTHLAKLGTTNSKNISYNRAKKFLATLAVIVSEAARMRKPFDKVNGGCLSRNADAAAPTRTSTIDETLFDGLFKNWGNISREILKGSEDWFPRFGINTIEDARNDEVRLILNSPKGVDHKGGGSGSGSPPPTSPGSGSGSGSGAADDDTSTAPQPTGGGGGGGGQLPQQQPTGAPQQQHQRHRTCHSDHGQPMIEVFALRADADFRPVGTVAIFDGRRGQVIYQDEGYGHDAPRKDSQCNLVLTGPHRAISADGRVAVEYCDSPEEEQDTKPSGQSSNVVEAMLWDPYDTKSSMEFQYDKLLAKDITQGLQMSYAVLSSAVEATVQVDLLLSLAPSLFEGLLSSLMITAHTQLINDNGDKKDVEILLFRSEMKEALEVVQLTSSFAGSTIPLARSVLAWPCGSPLVIKVVLQQATSPISSLSQGGTSTSSSTSIPFQGLDFSFDDHEDKIYLSPLQGICYVRVSVNVTGKNWLPGPSTIKMDMDLADPVETDLLVIHPRQLRFTLHPNEYWMHCLLHITNDTDDERVAFRLLPGNESPGYYYDYYNYYPIEAGVSGILPPNTTWTYLVRLQPQQEPLANMDMILRSCEALEGEDDVDNIFQRAIEEKQEIDETTLKAIVCHPAGQSMTSSDEVIPGMPEVIDLHPTEPWILAYTLEIGNGSELNRRICIWNYETMAEIASTEIKASICSIKFIAREPWFIAGDLEGYIHVYTWGTTMEGVQVQKVKAHKGGVTSLAVHPSEPLVLSVTNRYQGEDCSIKLWNWEEAGWKCTQTFEALHWTWAVTAVVKFNPNDGNAFACISGGMVEMWKISPPELVATLYRDLPDEEYVKWDMEVVCFDYFSTGGGQIWDLRNNSCITRAHGLQESRSWNAGVVQSHLGRPILVTASRDHAISLYDCMTYRCERTIDLKLGRVRDVQYSKSTQSLVINCDEGCAVMAI
ncbi:hypothetical protein U9M48_005623 [Paspalum notatum var. saurae]|uniref:DUF6598 domain-containing protein n=1 Tax=Paspalum notatum var. saurae TaxID=547442 RepID=A0AAQ3PRA3_PASNO